MKHVTMAEKSLLIGTEATDLLVEYAALLAQIGRGDSVKLNAIGADGEPVEVTFLLNSGTVLLAESSRTEVPEPDNGDAVTYLRSRLESYGPTSGMPDGSDQEAEQA